MILLTHLFNQELDLEPLIALQKELERLYKVDHSTFTTGQFQKLTQKLKLLRCEGQVSKGMYALANAVPNPRQRKKQGYIGTQSKSQCRRRDGMPRGAKRIPAGRPSKAAPPKSKQKRIHNLAINIENGVPSAKCH